jgi:hypothetical protein
VRGAMVESAVGLRWIFFNRTPFVRTAQEGDSSEPRGWTDVAEVASGRVARMWVAVASEPTCALRRTTNFGVCRFGLTGVRATNSKGRLSAFGRSVPAANVGNPVGQVVCQPSGGETARPTGASRPIAARGRFRSERPVYPGT